MRLDYEYVVQKLETNGRAVVEYIHPTYGSISVHMVLPIHKDTEQIRRRIIERFPLDLFLTNYLTEHPVEWKDKISGKFAIDFDDYFFDIQNETTCTEI